MGGTLQVTCTDGVHVVAYGQLGLRAFRSSNGVYARLMGDPRSKDEIYDSRLTRRCHSQRRLLRTSILASISISHKSYRVTAIISLGPVIPSTSGPWFHPSQTNLTEPTFPPKKNTKISCNTAGLPNLK